MFDNLGGIGDIVHPGSKVVIKTNLTGGNNFQAPDGFTSSETCATHPEVVWVGGELARDAGAGELYIVESVYNDQSSPGCGTKDIARDLNATLIDLNKPDPYSDFTCAPVGVGYYFIEAFTCNRILTCTVVTLRGDNYLNFASGLGLGANLLGEIEVVGAKIEAVKCQFEPAWEME